LRKGPEKVKGRTGYRPCRVNKEGSSDEKKGARKSVFFERKRKGGKAEAGGTTT